MPSPRWIRTASLILLAPVAVLPAQATLRGVVHDSLLTHRPLAGATVVVHGTDRTALTDRRGRFTIPDLPLGSHVVGFFHPSFDSLDLAAPGQRVELAAGRSPLVHLATPSIRGASLLLCRRPPEPSTLVLTGTVRAAAGDAPLARAVVEVRWFELALGGARARETMFVATDTTAADGRYQLCGVPTDIALTMVATAAGQTTGPVALAFDSVGVARRDLRVSLTDPSAASLPVDSTEAPRPAGRGRLLVVVRDPSGTSVSRAIVGLRGTDHADTTDGTGRAMIADLPSGTQTVAVRALGRQPQEVVVDIAPDAATPLTITLDRFVTLLPAVAVVGQAPDARLSGIQRRVRAGNGYVIAGDEVRALAFSSIGWARIPGVTLSSGRAASGPLIVQDDPVPMMRGFSGERCRADVWVDGIRFSTLSGWELRGMLLNARTVEVYASASRVPVEFTTVSASPCGAVLIWS
ncbi:MAG: carboxypeptidase regulatory-like domain-containing protein [Gemmatimonadetes bacterium]|nr:carboxypeptidase regulatory-like domain-containing protein [Gemmatimonadota bacterium]